MYDLVPCVIACMFRRQTDQIPGTRSLRVIRIPLGGRLDYNHQNRLESGHQNFKTPIMVRYPAIGEWDACHSGYRCTTTTTTLESQPIGVAYKQSISS